MIQYGRIVIKALFLLIVIYCSYVFGSGSQGSSSSSNSASSSSNSDKKLTNDAKYKIYCEMCKKGNTMPISREQWNVYENASHRDTEELVNTFCKYEIYYEKIYYAIYCEECLKNGGKPISRDQWDKNQRKF